MSSPLADSVYQASRFAAPVGSMPAFAAPAGNVGPVFQRPCRPLCSPTRLPPTVVIPLLAGTSASSVRGGVWVDDHNEAEVRPLWTASSSTPPVIWSTEYPANDVCVCGSLNAIWRMVPAGVSCSNVGRTHPPPGPPTSPPHADAA